MTTRPLKASDLPKLAEMAKRTGYPYPDPANTDHLRIVQNDDGEPVMAAGIRMVPEVYLWSGEFARPLAKVHAIRLLHQDLGALLRTYGFDTAYAIPVPALAKRFGFRLEKLFGWSKAQPMWVRKL